MPWRITSILSVVLLVGSLKAVWASVPSCRMDNTKAATVADALSRSIAAYKAIGVSLPIERIVVNPSTPPPGVGTLTAYVIKDAGRDGVGPDACPIRASKQGEPLDRLSVRGACVVVAVSTMEVRCSATSVEIFARAGENKSRANPALLYVLAHELGHLHQRRDGEYAGRTERIDLGWSRRDRFQALREACDPVSTAREEAADEWALKVLAVLLKAAPYREPVFTEQGSLYWNIDQLALATDAWQRSALEGEFASQPKLHASFTPTQFPTPANVIAANARRFVCEVLQKSKGAVLYPGSPQATPH